MYYSWAIVGTLLAAICCPLALWRGGTPERLGGGIIGVGWILSYWLQDRHGTGPGLEVFLIDLVTLILLAALSLWSRKIWALFAAAFQFNAVASHIVSTLFPEVGIVSYVTALGFWGGYGLLLALMAGVLGHERERRLAKEAS